MGSMTVASTTADRTLTRPLPCPRDGRKAGLLDCLAYEPGGCRALLPSLQCRLCRPFERRPYADPEGERWGQ